MEYVYLLIRKLMLSGTEGLSWDCVGTKFDWNSRTYYSKFKVFFLYICEFMLIINLTGSKNQLEDKSLCMSIGDDLNQVSPLAYL